MPEFELLLEGPAVSSRAAKKNRRRYQAWIQKVRTVAQSRWPAEASPIRSDVTVTITNIFTDEPPDIDNIIKPLLDGLCKVVFEDDRQVIRVTSQKFDMANVIRADEGDREVIRITSRKLDMEGSIQLELITSLLATGLELYKEVVHMTVAWE